MKRFLLDTLVIAGDSLRLEKAWYCCHNLGLMFEYHSDNITKHSSEDFASRDLLYLKKEGPKGFSVIHPSP